MKNSYSLLDFGKGRRLEQWGEWIIDRPDSNASGVRETTASWTDVAARFEEVEAKRVQRGKWRTFSSLPELWPISIDGYHFQVGLGTTKQLGLFPEQLKQWQELDRMIRQRVDHPIQPSLRSISVLNGFAYTGAASIVATMAGAKVTHIDSNGAAIGRAKQNQGLNNLPSDSIRWIKDDVLTFMRRELKRAHTYDVIILDPPKFGHGGNGEIFSLAKDLPELLALSRSLFSTSPILFQLTTYTNEMTPELVRESVSSVFGIPKTQVESSYLALHARSGKKLITGVSTIVSF